MEKYILVEWPDYQFFMDMPGFKERCFFCAEENIYFVPQSMYNIVAYANKA